VQELSQLQQPSQCFAKPLQQLLRFFQHISVIFFRYIVIVVFVLTETERSKCFVQIGRNIHGEWGREAFQYYQEPIQRYCTLYVPTSLPYIRKSAIYAVLFGIYFRDCKKVGTSLIFILIYESVPSKLREYYPSHDKYISCVAYIFDLSRCSYYFRRSFSCCS